MTKKEIIARRRIINSIAKVVPALIADSAEARAEARAALSSLRDAEMLLSLASLPARSADLARHQEQEQATAKDQGEQ